MNMTSLRLRKWNVDNYIRSFKEHNIICNLEWKKENSALLTQGFHAFPKVDLLSVDILMKILSRVKTLLSSIRSLWAFIMVQCVSLSCVMVLRSQVFSLCKAEKERSDAATDKGRARQSLWASPPPTAWSGFGAARFAGWTQHPGWW